MTETSPSQVMHTNAGVYRNGDLLNEGCTKIADVATHLDENLLVRRGGRRRGGGKEGGRRGGEEGGGRRRSCRHCLAVTMLWDRLSVIMCK